MEEKTTIKLNEKLLNFGIVTFIISLILLCIIDYTASEIRVARGDRREVQSPYGNKKTEITKALSVSIETPFGSSVRVSHQDDYYLGVGNSYKGYKDADMAKTDYLFHYVFSDIWVVFLVTFVLTLVKYISLKVKFEIS